MRPAPIVVWLVREGDPTNTEGMLSLEGASLTFVPTERVRERTVIPVTEIQKPRRHRGTPLLRISYPRPEGLTRLFFYFAKPPPLPGDRRPSPGLRPPRGIRRTAAAVALRASSQLVKLDIDAWVRALREAGAER